MAKQQIDISVNNDGFNLVQGDFVAEEATIQHQRSLVLTDKGEWKQNPTLGVGVMNYLDDENVSALIAAIAAEYVTDGMIVNKVSVLPNGHIDVEANY